MASITSQVAEGLGCKAIRVTDPETLAGAAQGAQG